MSIAPPSGMSPGRRKRWDDSASLRDLRVLWGVLVTLLLASHACGAHAQACREDEYYPGIERIGVRRSTDGGASWTFLGHACFHAPSLNPVDPSPLLVEGGVALYFFDLASLQAQGLKVVYRATTEDGVEFHPPVGAFGIGEPITDPFVLQMPNLTYRMYMNSSRGILSGSSTNGLSFAPDDGVRTTAGGVPGALLLPDSRVRLFLCGQWQGQSGIFSLIGNDGLTFGPEAGMRVPVMGNVTLVADPHPIRLHTGSFLMAYKIIPAGGQTPQDDLVRLARSADGLNWILDPGSIVRGSVPGLVEMPDGTLFLYYVDFHWRVAGVPPCFFWACLLLVPLAVRRLRRR
jgi:hypothetical protein